MVLATAWARLRHSTSTLITFFLSCFQSQPPHLSVIHFPFILSSERWRSWRSRRIRRYSISPRYRDRPQRYSSEHDKTHTQPMCLVYTGQYVTGLRGHWNCFCRLFYILRHLLHIWAVWLFSLIFLVASHSLIENFALQLKYPPCFFCFCSADLVLYCEAFLTTYRTFITPEDLIKKLHYRYPFQNHSAHHSELKCCFVVRRLFAFKFKILICQVKAASCCLSSLTLSHKHLSSESCGNHD